MESAPRPLTEEEVLAKYSNTRLRRNILPREARKLNMEFDANYNHMTVAEREEFLNELYPQELSDAQPD